MRTSEIERPSAEELGYTPATPFSELLIEADQPTEWLVEGIIPEQSLVLIHGRESSGKSYMMNDLAVSLALGADWHGYRIDRPRRVLLVVSESRKGTARRVASSARWKAVHDPEIASQLRKGLLLYRHEAPFNLNPKAQRHVELVILAKEIDRLGIEVVVFDVFADFTPELRENDRDMGHAMKMVAPDRLPGTPTTFLTHHEGWANKGRARGHSSMQGAADIRIAVSIESDNEDRPTRSVIQLRNKKQKEEDPFMPFGLILEKPDPDLNAPVITGAIPLRGKRQYEPSTNDLTENQARILQSVRTQYERGEVRQIDVHRDTGIAKTSVSSGVKALRSKGFLVDHDGPLIPTALGQAETSTNQYELSTNPISDQAASSTNPSHPLRGGRSFGPLVLGLELEGSRGHR